MDWFKILTLFLGSSVISTFITLAWNRYSEKKKLHAEIVSKARITWINEVRKISAEFIYYCHECIAKKRKRKRIKQRKNQFISECKKIGMTKDKINTDSYDNLIDKSIEDYNDYISKAMQKKTELALYFNTSSKKETSTDRHLRIRNKMKKLIDGIENYERKQSNQSQSKINKKTYHDLYSEIQDLSKIIGSYLKEEWEKAKKLK